MSFLPNLINEINNIRTNPSAFADKLLSFKNYFKGNIVRLPGQKGGLQTEEGFAAFEEAAKYLKTCNPVDEIIPSKGLSKIAKDYLDKIGESEINDMGEIEIDSIIKKYGHFTGSFSNGMDFGSETPELVAINLVVSDGDEDRGNRDLILNPKLKKIGISTRIHKIYGNLTIIVSCEDFINNVDKDDLENYGGKVILGRKQSQAGPKSANNPAPATPTAPTTTTNTTAPTTKNNDGNEINDPNILSCERRVRTVVERGKKKRKIIYLKKYKNGQKKKRS
jgi:hypothetical protein